MHAAFSKDLHRKVHGKGTRFEKREQMETVENSDQHGIAGAQKLFPGLLDHAGNGADDPCASGVPGQL